MKKFLKNSFFIVLIFCSFSLSAQAKTIKVVALKDFSTEKPSPTFRVQTIQDEVFKNGTVLEKGTVISGVVLKVEKPKRGKRDAYFEFIPTTIFYDGNEKTINKQIVVKVIAYHSVDSKKMAVYVAKKAADFAVKGASMGISFVQGVAQADEGDNRIKSGFVKTYRDSPLSFIEVGSELNIDVGDTLVLKVEKIGEKIH